MTKLTVYKIKTTNNQTGKERISGFGFRSLVRAEKHCDTMNSQNDGNTYTPHLHTYNINEEISS